MWKKLKKLRMFTLPEVMISVFCTGIVLSAGASLYKLNLYLDDMITRRTTCLSIAQSRLDYLRSLDYTILLISEENKVVVNGDGVPQVNGEYKRSTSIKVQDNLPCVEVLIKIESDPQNSKGRYDTYLELSTVIMDRTQIEGMQ